MSAQDTVASDYGLTDEASATVVGGGKERRIWRTTSVSPDPHVIGYFYAVQELAGEWKKVRGFIPDATGGRFLPEETQWCPRSRDLPPVSRVLWCTMDQTGQMVNAYRDASQGRGVK